jgi:hypothetical protein
MMVCRELSVYKLFIWKKAHKMEVLIHFNWKRHRNASQAPVKYFAWIMKLHFHMDNMTMRLKILSILFMKPLHSTEM